LFNKYKSSIEKKDSNEAKVERTVKIVRRFKARSRRVEKLVKERERKCKRTRGERERRETRETM
jgi:hypothetical protein